MNNDNNKTIGGMLSSADFREYVVTEDVPKMKEFFRRREWDRIRPGSFIIDPFDFKKLTTFSYDLSIGNEVFSCRTNSHSSFKLPSAEREAYLMQPGETVIVRTTEYIALPPCYSATVWPRFNFVREGIFQSMVKIDPTWYGQLGIALTNQSPTEYPIWKGREFATLILYKLTRDTDITLYRPGEILEEEKKIEEKINGIINQEEILKKLKQNNLEGKCLIQNGKLSIQIALTPEEFEVLKNLNEGDDWKKTVEKTMKIKTMDALGLPELDLILDKDPKGKRLERKSIATTLCTQQALINAAIEKGKPFDIIANMSQLVEKLTRGTVEKELNKEISRIILRIMALTLSLLGFISLIVAIIALVARNVQWDPPPDINWSETLVITMMTIGAVLIVVLICIFLPWYGKKGISKVRREMTDVNIELTSKLKTIDYKLRDKADELWKAIEDIKQRIT